MILAGIFLVLLTLDSVYLSVIVNPSPIANVTYGKPLFFNCTFPPNWVSASLNILGEIGFKFAIFKGGPCSVPSDKQSSYSISCHGNTLTYGILQPVEGQTWRCTSRNSNYDREHGNTTVSLQPDIPVITLQTSTYRIREGSNFSVPCTFSGAPIFNVTWEHSTTVIHWSNRNQPLILSFKNISRSSTGNYTCNVTVNFKGNYTASKSVNLVVEYIPVITLQTSTYRIREGSNFSIPCTFSAAPIFNVTWEHSTTVTHWSDRNQPLILNFKNISRSATGNYTCNVTVNFKGSYTASKTVSLVVEYPPTLVSSNDTIINEMGVVKFSCEISVDGFPRNYSELYWQHWIGDHLIRELHSDNPLINPSSKRYTLTLTSVTYNDTGNYVCLLGNGISNLRGEINQTAMVELVVQDCADGTYGPDCKSVCSEGCLSVCNKKIGTCEKCREGYTGAFCIDVYEFQKWMKSIIEVAGITTSVACFSILFALVLKRERLAAM